MTKSLRQLNKELIHIRRQQKRIDYIKRREAFRENKYPFVSEKTCKYCEINLRFRERESGNPNKRWFYRRTYICFQCNRTYIFQSDIITPLDKEYLEIFSN